MLNGQYDWRENTILMSVRAKTFVLYSLLFHINEFGVSKTVMWWHTSMRTEQTASDEDSELQLQVEELSFQGLFKHKPSFPNSNQAVTEKLI